MSLCACASLSTDLVYAWRTGIRAHVHHVDAGGDERGEDEEVAPLGGVAVATAAGVPAGVVQFVAEIGHLQPVDHLGSKVKWWVMLGWVGLCVLPVA